MILKLFFFSAYNMQENAIHYDYMTFEIYYNPSRSWDQQLQETKHYSTRLDSGWALAASLEKKKSIKNCKRNTLLA